MRPERLGRVKEDGAELTSDNVRAAKEGEVVMFALKPNIMPGAVGELAPFLQGKPCVSLAAAVTLGMLKNAAPGARWARAMTNICAAMNCAFTGISGLDAATDEDRRRLTEVFGLLGETEECEENILDALTALTGAAPAFFLTLMEAAAMGGVQIGLPKEIAYKGAASVLWGASRLFLEEGGSHPAALRDAVCTPGGMTIEGIYEIERSGARAAMMKAVVLTAKKGEVLTEKILKSLSL
jgi:pyrroline-5-carboxylate reductase